MSPEQIIVEIGGGGTRIGAIRRDASPKKRYVYLDRYKSELQKYQLSGYEAVGTLGFLPLKPAIADEIWLINVFGQICLQDSGFLKPYRLIDGRHVFCNSARNYFQDLANALKPQGSVYIGELYTPPDPECLTDRDFAEFGLGKTVYIGMDQTEFVREQGLGLDVWEGFLGKKVFGKDTFFMRLQKTGNIDSQPKKFF